MIGGDNNNNEENNNNNNNNIAQELQNSGVSSGNSGKSAIAVQWQRFKQRNSGITAPSGGITSSENTVGDSGNSGISGNSGNSGKQRKQW